ncbi:bifunctional [glutamine synthetase] adenylyltransferase/[glutamine synthetase]-adenylyl-L-tyrosine phosphorylase [Magnetospira thiophila]
MINPSLRIATESLPKPARPNDAALGWERLHDAVGFAKDADLAAWAESLHAAPEGRVLLDSLFGNSPYLTQCAVIEPVFLHDLLSDGPQATLDRILAELAALALDLPDFAGLSRHIRLAKRRIALLTGLADVAGVWTLEQVTGALSALAEMTLGLACARVLTDTAARGAFTLAHPDDPQKGSGLVILGMGKLGGRELNYSSDIDLIVLYDTARIRTDQPEELQTHMVRLTRNLVKLMDERTSDGYVFRTDLRLRPDPGSTPVALSVLAAETYYESIGQNWERAAMIKARPVAGDIDAGNDFLSRLRPYVWRKNLDFASLQDIHAIKRQIHAHKGGAKITVAGHNVKLGRGGIREIEFFVQTQQLIWGGRLPDLRIRPTLQALEVLVDLQQVERATADELIESYHFLRRVEHRLQMIDDQQTHSLPEDEADLHHLAVFLGYAGRDDFAAALLYHLRRVEAHYAALFECAPDPMQEASGNLVFTGSEDDPETLKNLRQMGFDNPSAVAATVRGWHHGRYNCTRSVRARELLTELMPALLGSLARTPDPDPAFQRLDTFLSRLPTGVQFFSLIQVNPNLLDMVARILGGAPRLADHLARNPVLLDNVLTPGFFEAQPDSAELDQELDGQLVQASHFEERLNNARRWANDRRFQCGLQVLHNLIAPVEAALTLTNIAESTIRRLSPWVEEEFRQTHGHIPGADMVVLGMGKMGGQEMTPTSDLDLIFIYDSPDPMGQSLGRRPLGPSQYYARLSQRLINAFTAPTGEGILYEVDMRLRPSGNAGPIATSLQAFEKYQKESAWTWEHLALTRARPVSGSPELSERIMEIVHRTLTRDRDPEALLRDVASMRRRMAAEHGTDSPWEIKHYRGGLVDIEFLVQYLQLRHAGQHPTILCQNTRGALDQLHRAGLLRDQVKDDLCQAVDLWQALQGILRLVVTGPFEPGRLHEGLKETLAAAGKVARFDLLEEKIRALAATAHAHYMEIIDGPARALPPLDSEEDPS